MTGPVMSIAALAPKTTPVSTTSEHLRWVITELRTGTVAREIQSRRVALRPGQLILAHTRRAVEGGIARLQLIDALLELGGRRRRFPLSQGPVVGDDGVLLVSQLALNALGELGKLLGDALAGRRTIEARRGD